MATSGYNSSPFILPNAFGNPGDVLSNIIQNQRQDKEIEAEREYRKQRENDADQWKKIALIQDLTDLSKHQTGSDVANAIGNLKAAEILRKYTTKASVMSPSELMASISQDMNGVISGMDALKTELEISDKELAVLKQQFPELKIGEMAQAKRADIVNRRMRGTEFINPLEVNESELDFGNPEVLSDFVADDRTLVNAITSPKGAEQESVLMGRQGDYTKFEGKRPFWKKTNFDRTKFDPEGFYRGKEIPSFTIKGSEIPSDSLPSSNGRPFKVIDKDVYEQFIADGNQYLSLLSATKKAYPDYNKFNPTEKEYAQRNVLYSKIETLDQSQLHPTQNVRPPITRVSVSGSNGGSKPPEQIDLRDKNEYPQAGGGFQDVSRLFQGVKVTGLPDGTTLNAEYVRYNPVTKKIKYKEFTGTTEKETDLTTFFQNIKTNNPQIDMKFLEGLRNPITSDGDSPKPQGGSINISEIPAGTKLEQKGGKYYYKGKEVKI